MRAKLTILFCAVLVLALGSSQVYGQDGFDVYKTTADVVKGGTNQEVGRIELHFDNAGGVLENVDTYTLTWGVPVTAAGTVTVGNGVAVVSSTLADDVLTIVTDGAAPTADGVKTIDVTGTRLDVRGLAVGAEISVTVASADAGGLIPVGQNESSVSTVVGTVAAGFTVANTAGSRLVCALDAVDGDGDPAGGIPTITLTEGIIDAFEPDVFAGNTATHITFTITGLPTGVLARWPLTSDFDDPDNAGTMWGRLTLQAPEATEALAGGGAQDADNDGSSATYKYSAAGADAALIADVFEIEVTFDTSAGVAQGGGGTATITASLSPQPADEDADIATVLSYAEEQSTAADLITVTDCVTYLLFPYITCGAHADWDTGITIANTTLDDDVFSISTGATATSGAVTLHAYPTSTKTADGSSDAAYTGTPTTAIISAGLSAGDSISITCGSNTTLAGSQGYAIAKAGFLHAHGMGFVMNMTSGAVDAVHGYIALVIRDPDDGAAGTRGTSALRNESLGQ